jgi:hypothetical protein
MSVVIALISTSGGVVASDGRTIRGGELFDDNFDKTFSLCQHRIVGTFAGSMGFGGRSVAQHLREIEQEQSRKPESLVECKDIIREHYEFKVNTVSDNGLLLELRKSDILLVGGKYLTDHYFQIVKLCFRLNDNKTQIICTTDELIECSETGCNWIILGDDSAVSAANQYMRRQTENYIEHNFEYFAELTQSAIQCGIDKSGFIESCQYQICGGNVFCDYCRY